jgi:5-(carboxyamino)imidazole ribonucleotide mutase
MGSDSDWRVMSDASQALTDFGIAHEVEVVSAHRTPDKLLVRAHGSCAGSARSSRGRGAAHLPGMLASVTALPVIGVPVQLATLDGMDSLLSIVQMPAGIPVATVSINGRRTRAFWPRGSSARPTRIWPTASSSTRAISKPRSKRRTDV